MLIEQLPLEVVQRNHTRLRPLSDLRFVDPLGAKIDWANIVQRSKRESGGELIAFAWMNRCVNRFLAWCFTRLFERYKSENVYIRETIYEESITTRTITATDPQSLFHQIDLRQMEVRMIYDGRVDTIIIGAAEFSQIQREAALTFGPFAYRDQLEFRGKGGIKVCGLNVVVLPWVKGWCLVSWNEIQESIIEVPRGRSDIYRQYH